MPKVVPITKRLTESQAHDYVSTQHRVDEYINRMESHIEPVDEKAWTWAKTIFYILLVALIMGALAWKEARACGEEVKPMEPIKIVRGI